MDGLRITATADVPARAECSRCAAAGERWDRIAGKTYCPNCQELLALGEAPPLIERTTKHRCAACQHVGTVSFLTFPLQQNRGIEIDLCPEHLRSLLGRRLGPSAFHQLRRQLSALGLETEELFLLHGAFYDGNGRALQPALATE